MFYNSNMNLDEIIKKLNTMANDFYELQGMLICYQQLKKDNILIVKDPNSSIISFKERYPSLRKFESKDELNKKENAPEEEQQMRIKGITIFRNKNCSTWYTRYRKDGKQYYISGKTQQEVANKLKEKLEIKKNTKTTGITFFEWYEKWLNLYKIGKVKEATLADYKSVIKNIPKNLLDKDIKSIKLEDIIILLNSISAERQKQKVYELLKAIFDKAENHKIIKDNIMKLIDKPKHKKSKGIALNLEQQKLFIEKCNTNRFGNLYKLILFQGLRIGEALGLTSDNINLNNLTITINKTINQENQFDTTKNEQSNRCIPIFKPSINIVKNLKVDNNTRLFPYSYRIVHREFKNILKNTKLSNDLSIHDLRHTFITNCQNENIPEHIIQSWVGHQIGSCVTKNVYTHITDDANLFNINKLNNSELYSNSTQQ